MIIVAKRGRHDLSPTLSLFRNLITRPNKHSKKCHHNNILLMVLEQTSSIRNRHLQLVVIYYKRDIPRTGYQTYGVSFSHANNEK